MPGDVLDFLGSKDSGSIVSHVSEEKYSHCRSNLRGYGQYVGAGHAACGMQRHTNAGQARGFP